MTQYQRFELSRIDSEIAELEKKMAVKHEQRRELVNRMGLNKCEHKNLVMMQGFYISKDHPENIECHDFCTDCGAKLAIKSNCEHKSKTCATSKCHCDDCGCQLPWQHTEIKP